MAAAVATPTQDPFAGLWQTYRDELPQNSVIPLYYNDMPIKIESGTKQVVMYLHTFSFSSFSDTQATREKNALKERHVVFLKDDLSLDILHEQMGQFFPEMRLDVIKINLFGREIILSYKNRVPLNIIDEETAGLIIDRNCRKLDALISIKTTADWIRYAQQSDASDKKEDEMRKKVDGKP